MRHLRVGVCVFSALCLCLFFISNAYGQMPASSSTTSTPVPGAGHDYLGDIGETVNPATGSLSIRISATMPAGRGLTLPFTFAYDSNGVNYVGLNSPGILQWLAPSSSIVSTGGWSESAPIVSASQLKWTAYPDGGGKGVPCFGYVNYVYQDPQGNRHDLNLSIYSDVTQSGLCTNDTVHWPIGFDGEIVTQGGEGNWSPIEGAIVASIPDTSIGSPVTVTQPDGAIFYFAQNASQFANGAMATSVEDRNGNVVAITPPGSVSGPYSYKDTLGRTVLEDSGFATSSETVTISGLSAPYKLSWSAASAPSFVVPITTLAGTCSAPSHAPWTNPTTDIAMSKVSTLTLPNGKSFSFLYDSTYNLVNKITYPTGGYVRYVWGMNPKAEFGTYRNPEQQCGLLYGMPVITDRYVSFDGSTEVLHQQFSYSPAAWNTNNPYGAFWTNKQTTVTTTDAVRNATFRTVYTYAPMSAVSPPNTFTPTQSDPVESSIAYYDTTGALLKTVSKTWANLRLLSSQTTTYPTGQSSETAWSYNSREMRAEQDDYDFGGALLRKTVTNYQQFANTPLYPNGPSIVNRPCQVVTYGTGSRVAETDYFYDNGATGTVCGTAGTPSVVGAGGSSLTGHDEANYGATSTHPRGNLTQKTEWLNIGPTSPITTYAYDETGQTISMTDPCGNGSCSDISGTSHTTTYAYADNYSSGTPPGETNAYLTRITDALGHPTSYAYGYSDGQLTSSTDQNGQITGYKYNTPPSGCSFPDDLDRLSEIDYPDLGKTTYCYNDAAYNPSASSPSVTTTIALTSVTNKVSTVAFDGMRHTVQTILSSDPQGSTQTASTYDGLGRAYQTWNPTRCSPAKTNCGENTWGITAYAYDAINRITSSTEPDNSQVLSTYSGNCTTVTDEAGKVRKSCVDGLGRLTGVWEDPNNLNYETDYQYDALNDLTEVTQGSETRSFSYDSLARLSSALNPESTSLAYVYDNNGNVTLKTDARGITTKYFYDTVNRLTQKSIAMARRLPDINTI